MTSVRLVAAGDVTAMPGVASLSPSPGESPGSTSRIHGDSRAAFAKRCNDTGTGCRRIETTRTIPVKPQPETGAQMYGIGRLPASVSRTIVLLPNAGMPSSRCRRQVRSFSRPYSVGESPMRFEIRISDQSHWSWVLVNETEETVVASRRSFPSRAQAMAAAMAFAQLVARAGRTLGGVPRAGGFL